MIIIYIPCILTISGNSRYYLLAFLCTIPLISLGIEKSIVIHKFLPIVFTFFVIFFSMLTFSNNIAYNDNPSKIYIETGYFSPEYRYYSICGYEKLKSLHPTGVVLSGQSPETMLYSNATVTWISPFGGSEFINLLRATNSIVVKDIIRRYNIQYVVVNKMDYRQTFFGPIPRNMFYETLKRGLYAKKVYHNPWIDIYKVTLR